MALIHDIMSEWSILKMRNFSGTNFGDNIDDDERYTHIWHEKGMKEKAK